MTRKLCLLIAVAAAVAACDRMPEEAVRRGTQVGPLRTFTSVTLENIRPGDSVFVRVAIVNTADTTLDLKSNLVSCPISVEVRGPGPVNYYRGMPLCQGPGAIIPSNFVLVPHDSLVGTGWWPGTTYGSTAGDVLGTTRPAPPGVYFAVAYIWWDLRHMSAGDSARVVVQRQ